MSIDQGQPLKDKTVTGVGWSAAGTVLQYGVSFIVGIVLARLLSPDEYGLIGILTIFITLFEIIIDGGFANALIRKKDAKDTDYSTVFYVNMILSIGMALVLFISAKPIAHFFDRTELVSLTRAMSPIIVINALAIIQRVRLTKSIDFKPQTLITFTAALISGVVGVFMAFREMGVWALVGQQYTNAIMITLLLWIYNRWWPGLRFSVNSFREMWQFGWKLLASGLLNSFSEQLHSAVIGKIYSPSTLGQFTRASQFGGLFSGNISNILSKVSYPVLSTIQDNNDRLKDAYKRLIKTTVLPTFILMMGLCAMAKPLLITLIGEKWTEAAGFLQILCFSMMQHPLHRLNISALLVMGRSDLNLKINIIKNLTIIFPVAVGILFNIYWMLIADLVRTCFAYYLNTYYSGPLLKYPIKEQLKDVAPAFILSVLIALPVFPISLLPFSSWVVLSIQVVVWVTLVMLVLEKTKLPEYLEIKDIMNQYLKKRKKETLYK